MGAPKKFPIQPYVWPEKPICITAYALDARKGETADLVTPPLQTFPAFNTPEAYTSAHNNALPHTPCTHGHNTQTTLWGDTFCLNPLFVRDLAGRVIYIGAGTTAPATAGLFPPFCQHVHAGVAGSDFIDNSFFVNFLPLEFSAPAAYRAHLTQETFARTYQNPQHYPYKLRIDSFYQDGWRLPQTERLFVKTHAQAGAAATQFLQAWKNRPAGQAYLDFVEAHGGENWFEELFQQGVTVIPTTEAHNGYNVVNDAYTLIDFHNGRATPALHTVAKEIPHDSPRGTILTVITPGIAYDDTIIKAKVTVSDGSGYTTFKTAPVPQRPDLSLPHPKLNVQRWRACWLPTHPAHFAPPALYDWQQHESHATPQFMQIHGPLWEPLHYVYASTAKILRAFKTPRADNPALAAVPDEMLLKFHPIVGMNTYDTFNEVTRAERQNMGAQPRTYIDRIPHAHAARVGYHPLPEHFTPPQMLPSTPAACESPSACPDALKPLLMPIITLNVTATTAKNSVKTTSAELNFWQDDAYYTHGKPAWPNLHYSAAPLPLPYCDPGQLTQNIRRAVGGKTAKSEIDSLGVGVYDAYYQFRKEALAQRRGWYRNT